MRVIPWIIRGDDAGFCCRACRFGNSAVGVTGVILSCVVP